MCCFKLNWAHGIPVWEALEKIVDICAASFKQNLKDCHDVMIFRDPEYFETPARMFRKIFDLSHAIWKGGDNLLFVDADSLCIRPTEVFNLPENQFRLFGSAGDITRFEKYFPYYFLSGVRYLPSGMDPALWDLGEQLWEEFDKECALNPLWREHNRWDFEQYVYNRMFYHQRGVKERYEDFVNTKMNQFFLDPDARDSNILSLNASAMRPVLPQIVKHLAEAYGITWSTK